jgi:hypothetical protein
MLPTCTLPEESSGRAASNRPQREPTSVISLTIAGAVSIDTRPWTVDFMITVPRGMHIETAARSPSDEPVVNDERPSGEGELLGHDFRGDSGPFDQPHFFFMPAKKMHLRTPRLKHLRDEKAELAIAQDRHALALGDFHLVENLASGRNRFDENGVFGWDGRGHAMQVADRQRQELAEGSRMLDDA